MALDVLPTEFQALTRDQLRSIYLRSIKIRNPGASIAQDTQPWIDGSAVADVASLLSLNAKQIARNIPLSEVSGDRLDQRLKEYGLPPRFPESGSQGAITVSTGTSGANIPSGTQWTDTNGLRYQVTTTNLYHDGDSVPMAAIDTGTQTNIDAGTVLICSVGIPGLFQSATVTEQTDGTGFSGGRGPEGDDEVRQRISDELANPAAAGNDAEYQKLVGDSLGHGVAVQKPFTYPAINGPGTMGVAFTMKPATTGGSRIPNSTQRALVKAFVRGQLPCDDSYLDIALISQPTRIVMDVSWAQGAAGWEDATPWPPRVASGSGAYIISLSTSPTQFAISTDTSIYTGTVPPVAGNTIAFFDPSSGGQFRRKKILSVSGAGPWNITADTSNAQSDTTYTPVVGQPCCPWSDSLQTLVSTVTDYFSTLGPGEQVSTFFDPGLRQKRNPPAPKYWPYSISNKLAGAMLELQSVNDLIIREGLGAKANTGTPGATAYLLELEYIAAFPL